MKLTKAVAGLVLATTALLPAITASQANSIPIVADKDIPQEKITVFIMADGAGKEYLVPSGTTETVLEAAHIKLGEADQVSSGRGELVKDKQLVVVNRVEVKTVEKSVAIDFKSTVQKDKVTCEKSSDEEKVVTAGKAGEKVETWSVVTIDGAAMPEVKMNEVVSSEAVDEVKAPCAPPVAPQSTSNSSNSTSSVPNVAISGTKQDWMKAAGIPESDWAATDWIITRESGWNPTATNPSSGAYGLPQSLPATKLSAAGNDWKTNPVTQLKWFKTYCEGRYGSISNAVEFWKSHSWY